MLVWVARLVTHAGSKCELCDAIKLFESHSRSLTSRGLNCWLILSWRLNRLIAVLTVDQLSNLFELLGFAQLVGIRARGWSDGRVLTPVE